jgi:hypothetical protein
MTPPDSGMSDCVPVLRIVIAAARTDRYVIISRGQPLIPPAGVVVRPPRICLDDPTPPIRATSHPTLAGN